MARYERGVYEPSDEVRVFDGAEEDEDDAEGSRLPLLIVLALVVLCAFAGVVWLAYTQGVARGRTETPVLAAAPGPERVAPENAGGAEVPYQGFKIYEQPAPPDEGDAPAAPPQQAAKAEPPAAPAAAPPPTQQPATTRPAIAAAQPAPVTRQAAAPPAPKPVPPPPATRQAATPPAPSTAQAAPGTATGAPRALPGVAAATPPKPVPASAPAMTAAAASGAYVLQIGAFASQAEADAAWKAYSGKHAALLKGYGPNVQQVDLGAKGTWYRLRIAGFADRDVATALCDRLKANGAGACFLGK